MKLPINCFVCDDELKDVFNKHTGGDTRNEPSQATVFSATGNYGSGVFDPLATGQYLQINVCDDCLIVRKPRVLFVDRELISTYKFKQWENEG